MYCRPRKIRCSVALPLILAFCFIGITSAMSASSSASSAATPEKSAVSALIKFANPQVNTQGLDLARLTQAQIAAIKQSLSNLQGKKFIIFKGQVFLLEAINIQITETNNVVLMSILKKAVPVGTTVLADLRVLDKADTCDPNGSWYDYLYCYLENIAKTRPGAMIGEDSLLLGRVRSYLDTKYMDKGGCANNFVIAGEGNSIYVKPKAENSLQGLDRIVSFSFENDPMEYDKKVIVEFLKSLKDTIAGNNADIFFVVDDNLFEPMSVYDINNIITANPTRTTQIRVASVALPAAPTSQAAAPCHLPAWPTTCYDCQFGSVIPCNKEIDYVEGLKDKWSRWPVSLITLFYNDLKQLETLKYKVIKIHDKDPKYAGDGVEFLKALIETPGQVLAIALHGTGFVTDEHTGLPLEPDGFIYPIGCIPNTIQAKDDLLRRLESLYPCYLKERPTEAVQDPCYGGWTGDVYFTAGRGCGSGNLGWGIRLYDTNIRTKAIEIGYPCHGELGAMTNAIVTYLDAPELKSAGRARFDIKLFTNYLLGMGPSEMPYESPYNYYPPRLEQQYNINVKNTLDFGGPCGPWPYGQQPPCSDGCSFNPESCTKEVEGTGGIMRTVSVPCTMRPGNSGNAHLFPYVKELNLVSGSRFLYDAAESQLSFSDAIFGNPTLDFRVKGGRGGRDAIQPPGLTRLSDESLFSFRFIPEVDVVDAAKYYEYYKKNKAQYIPKSILTIKGATAKANEIEMVGNPLASHTAEDINDDPAYKVPYFPYNQYFWTYNARTYPGRDIRSFKANIPYKLHPWVSNLRVNGQDVQFDFSSDVAPVSPCQVIKVDASQCTNLKAIYAKNGGPRFVANDPDGRKDALQFTLENDITLFQPGDSLPGNVLPKDWKYALKVTLKGGVAGLHSFWNHFPLQGNRGTPEPWYLDKNGINGVDVWESNSDEFPQTEGDFTVLIPCAPRKSACCIPAKDGSNYSTCEDMTFDECTKEGGSFNDGKNCLLYDHYGTPGADGRVTGRCPGTCPRKPQGFIFHYDYTSTKCDDCIVSPELCREIHSANQRIEDFSYYSHGTHCPGTFGSTWFGKTTMLEDSCADENTYMSACYFPVANEKVRENCLSVPLKDLDCPSDSCSRGGNLGCNGGFLTQTTKSKNADNTTCSRTTTITIGLPRCGTSSYAVKDKNGNIKCCKLNEEWDVENSVCKPIYTSQYCSPTQSPWSSS